MRIPRIFHPEPLASGAVVELEPTAANHVAKVLRLRPGAALVLFDGDGGEYRAALLQVERRSVRVDIGAHVAREVESPLELTLAQGISRGERMDFTVQKAVELGIARIIPVLAERTAVNLDGDRKEKRVQRWRGIAVSACEQCGRNRVPVVEPVVTLSEWLGRPRSAPGLLLDPEGGSRLSENLGGHRSLDLLIGPEGGFTAEESAAAMRAGLTGISLGPRVLRTETAAVAVLAVLQARFGDLG